MRVKENAKKNYVYYYAFDYSIFYDCPSACCE